MYSSFTYIVAFSPNRSIGGLRPNEISSNRDDVLIDNKIGVNEDVDWEQQNKSQKRYEKSSKDLQKGDFVFVPSFGPSALGKSTDTNRHQIYQISRVDAGKTPHLFKLQDLKQKEIPGFYYRAQLLKTEEPQPGQTFKIEKVIKVKKIKSEKWAYVKYLHYPAVSFDIFIIEI